MLLVTCWSIDLTLDVIRPFAWQGWSNDYCQFHFGTLLECNASVPKSEDEFYLALETESFSVCAGPDRLLANHQGRLPRICLPDTDNVDNM